MDPHPVQKETDCKSKKKSKLQCKNKWREGNTIQEEEKTRIFSFCDFFSYTNPCKKCAEGDTNYSSDADPAPPEPYHFPGSGSVSKVGLDPDLYQMIRIQIQQKPLKTENKIFLVLNPSLPGSRSVPIVLPGSGSESKFSGSGYVMDFFRSQIRIKMIRIRNTANLYYLDQDPLMYNTCTGQLNCGLWWEPA